MKTTFKDRILSLYRRTVYKHSSLRIPMIILCTILLFFNRVGLNIRSNGKRLLGLAFVLTFSFMSCSFSGVIWGYEATDFADASAKLYAETEQSYAVLVSESEVDTEIIEEDETFADIESDEDGHASEGMTGADILDAIDFETLEAVDTEAGSEEEISFARDDWRLVLINKQHPIPDDYTFTLGSIKAGMQCDERVIPDLYLMIEAAYKDGVNLVISSPYRAAERQVMLFERKINNYTKQGMSYMEAYKLAAQAVTIPGCSEHEVGLAFDITCDTYSSLNEGFGETKAGKWLAENSADYGFIVRYPAGKEDITGIEYEPWHFRYVGKNAAKVMIQEQITLEEFWERYL